MTSVLTACTSGSEASRGLWPLPRHDAGNTARSDIAGNMTTAPHEVWRWGNASKPSSLVVATDDGSHLVQVRGGLESIGADGKTRWSRTTLGVGAVLAVEDFAGDGHRQALVSLGTSRLALIDVTTGQTRWQWTLPAPGRVMQVKVFPSPKGARIILFPVNTTLAFCFDFSGDLASPRLVWRKDYAGRYLANFGPVVVVTDMNKDGKADLVIAGKQAENQPYVGVINAESGELMFDLNYSVKGGSAGRPYGLVQAADLDADGFPDIVVASGGVEEYIGVIHNDAGKGLSLAWSRFIEKDWPHDFKSLRPTVTSVADLCGDGKPQLVLGIFNDTGDERWHTLVFDALSGKTLADLPEQYLWGCFDLDGDGKAEIVTSLERARALETTTTLTASKFDGSSLKPVATIAKASLPARGVGTTSPLPDSQAMGNAGQMPYWVTKPTCEAGLIVRCDGQTQWWRLSGAPRLEPFIATTTAWSRLRFEKSPRWERLDLKLPSIDVDEGPSASMPLVSMNGNARELSFALSDGTIIGGVPDFLKSGAFKKSWKIEGRIPAIWQSQAGRRTVCAWSADGKQLLLYPFEAEQSAAPDARRTDLPLPAEIHPPGGRTDNNTIQLFTNAVPVGIDHPRVFVPLQSSPMTFACAVFDEQGRQVWLDEKHGPYPRSAAACDAGGPGKEFFVVDDHGKHVLYDAAGHATIFASGWSDEIPRRADGAKYALPMIGPFAPDGSGRIIMASGLDALEVLDLNGARLAKYAFPSAYYFGLTNSAAAKTRSHGWGCGQVSTDGIFECVNLADATVRWKLDLGVIPNGPVSIASGDIDGDGDDNFLVGLPDGRVVALAERRGVGSVLWSAELGAPVVEVVIADINGDGAAEVIVETNDGVIHVLACD